MLGFAPAGRVAPDASGLACADTVFAGGAGARSLIPKRTGVPVRFDCAVGPETSAVSSVVGSHWRGL